MPTDTEYTGTLIRVHTDGYGFIRADQSHEEFFVALKDWPNRASWFTGQTVGFSAAEPNSRGKARRAVNLTLLARRRKAVSQ